LGNYTLSSVILRLRFLVMVKISVHGDGWGNALQRKLLEAEGVIFDDEGKVDFDLFEWFGPDEQDN